MTLTAGTALQNGKYIIESVLHQSDQCITYQATQHLLERAVIIQTLSQSLCDRPDRDTLCQQVLAALRQAVSTQPPTAPIVDCFVENHQPFVVFAGASPDLRVDLATWLPPLDEPAAITAPAPEPETIEVVEPSSASAPELPSPSGAIATPAPEPEVTPDDRSRHPFIHATRNGTVMTLEPVSLTPTQNGATPTAQTMSPVGPSSPGLDGATHVAQRPQTPQRRSPRLLPLALVCTSVAAGIAGAAVGWKIRQNPTQPGAAISPLINRDQDFPPQADWPPSLTTDDALEQPTTTDTPSRRNSRTSGRLMPYDSDTAPTYGGPSRERSIRVVPAPQPIDDYAYEEPMPLESEPSVASDRYDEPTESVLESAPAPITKDSKVEAEPPATAPVIPEAPAEPEPAAPEPIVPPPSKESVPITQ